MALVDTSNAIGAVTGVLKARLTDFTGKNVSTGRPDQADLGGSFLNLFLYEISYDPHLKNIPLNDGEKPPIWMVLKYLLTAFELKGISDSEEAHNLLGSALRAIHRDDFFSLEGLIPDERVKYEPALESNPSELHITLDESPAELLARLMQGSDEKVRLSVCFQVRPVMIAPADLPSYSLLVGVDYTKAQPAEWEKPEKAIRFDVLPSMGASISGIEPTGFEVKEKVKVFGTDLNLQNLSVRLGPLELPVTMQTPNELWFTIDPDLAEASNISAGSYPLSVVQTLTATGKKRGSNVIIGNLVPTLEKVTVITQNMPPNEVAIDLEGLLLGKDTDDTILALYLGGRIVKVFEAFKTSAATQKKRRLIISDIDKIKEADYLVILIVNGQRAALSPVIHIGKA